MLNEDDFNFLTGLIKDKSGIALTAAKTYLLESRLTPLATKQECNDLPGLVAKIRKTMDSILIYQVIEAMTTNETLFFRDDKPFRHVQTTLLPEMLKTRAHKKHLRIWSAACSTGQEPYSIAIILHELLQNQPGWTLDIVATDISQSVLEQGKNGIYSQFEIQRGLPATTLVKYFTRTDSTWQIQEQFRRMVRFEAFNLLQPMEKFGTFDLIFCRNVLIYFDEATKKKVLTSLSRRLASDGYLMLGGAESAMYAEDALSLAGNCPGLYKPATVFEKMATA